MFTTMEEDLIIPHDSAKNCSISVIEDEKEKVKDFVYKHFREVTDGSLFSNAEESSIKELGSSTKKDKQTLNKAHCKIQQGAVFSGKILSFGCSVCKDDSTYSPNDLLKHFRAAHKGTLPTYPCDLCGFVTNEFPALQRHRIEHRNTLVTCELCNDDVQYSLLLLTRHYIMCHSLNGQFNCDWCEFTTVDAGTFVQHIHHHNESPWKCSKCRHISLNEEDHQRHVKAHSGTFPFTCQICGYGAARSEYLKKHTSAVHKQEAEKRNAWKAIEDSGTTANSSATLKLLLKKSGESQESQRISKLNCLSASFTNQNGRLIKPELSLAETHHFVDGIVAKKDNNYWSKGSHNTEQSTPPLMVQECDNSTSSDAASHTNPNGLTVLMVKNKISLPPNCTTKVMGFKMVDGKKHLVLKVIPTTKQDSSIQNHSSGEDVGFLAPNPVLDKSKDSIENGECFDSKSSTSHCFAVSPRSGSCIQMDQDDIMAVKVKTEEEETSVCNLDSTPHRDDVGEQTYPLLNMSSTCADMLYPMTNEFDHVGDQSHPSQTTSSERSTFDNNSDSATFNSVATSHSGCKISNTLTVCADKVTGLSSLSKVAQETLLSESVSRKTAENCRAATELSLTDTVADKLTDKHKGSYSFKTTENDDPSSHSTSDKAIRVRTEIKRKNGQRNFKKLSTNPVPPLESSPPTSCSYRESAMGSENCHQNSPNQEVFTFHNYSKETFSTSPSTTQSFDSMSEHSADRESICKSSQFSLILAKSPEPFVEGGNGGTTQKNGESMKKASNSDIEVDECIASVDDPPTEDENPESVLQDFNIIKIEEESIPISKKQSETKGSSSFLGSFVEEHSDAIITQQLNKERVRSSSASSDSLKQTKTTLRILQLPEGKQPVLLRTSENRFAMPVQVKATPGFKLITNSANPQINVSYMKPGLERSSNQTGVTLTPNSRRLGVSTSKAGAAEKGTTLLSAVQPGVCTTSNHYLINSPGFKGPVLLSSTPQNTPLDKSAKTQPTCYLVQRSVPFVHTPSTPGLRLASTQLSLNSRPMLAMPMSSADKPSTLQPGRQAFLLRYISPPKSGLLLNNQETKTGTQCSQTSDSIGNKVIFKIVTPTGSLLTSGAPTSSSQPLFLATRPQTQCFLVSSNKTNANASNGVKKLITIQNTAQKDVKESCISPSQMNVKVQPCEADKPRLAPRPIRPPSQRKRRRKPLFDELTATVHKARRLANKVLTEKETAVLWKPVAKEVERTLRLAPFSSVQQIKCPRRYQPVVVLNHPDADIPEVANIMKVVNRYKGAVTKVSLSQKTIQVLSELGAQGKNCSTKGVSSHSADPRPRPVQSSVRERFLLKLKLRKKSKKKYEVVETLSGCRQESVVFDCWFCGRLFNSQEDWIGHGQRHLMEATRDWNKLF
ncbi:zinc finger protein 518A-like [Xiphias gladius]|uniref:zinc finger protein 518A-like n=1 Tax=Xiphias gladius TaxID=8245 RepID=UPI001A99C036|nr:zinc finger protein 518A-like [Xiphias gladius]XP_039978954.1 zinc finger protein 518A-like [Xiphias gladius]XP_039978955.1 zinc finger protein 518A-like [Xiphias gladius]XP_039978956.1 zinc finger protein 518A-like [Xiphias gladius]XP_039978957.1 zinc finger protein 518A-like [Xiphias gladius]